MCCVSNPLCKIDKLSFICIIYIWMFGEWGGANLNIQYENQVSFQPKAFSNKLNNYLRFLHSPAMTVATTLLHASKALLLQSIA